MWASDRDGGAAASLARHATAAEVDVYAAFVTDRGMLVVELPVTRGPSPADGRADFPGLATLFPGASRMQRAMFDLSAVRASDPDHRPWLRHPPEGYDFVRVSGEGVHEIAVGPVHAGTIEPGHFRFSVVGEKVLRLEERLGYTHKGIERRFTELPLLEGHRLAARIAGDSAVAYSWAYCQALEGMAGCVVPPRAAALRALFLELERIANHLGDLGALANDAGFAFGLAQFSRLKEELLRAVSQAFGQRYLLDAVVPGGAQPDIDAQAAAGLAARIAAVASETTELRDILRGSRRRAGPFHRHRHPDARARLAARRPRARRPRQRAGARCAGSTSRARPMTGLRRPGWCGTKAMSRRASRCASMSSRSPAGWRAPCCSRCRPALV